MRAVLSILAMLSAIALAATGAAAQQPPPGPLAVRDGLSGSLIFTGSAAIGRVDQADLTGGGRLNYRKGDWTHSLSFGVELGELRGATSEREAFLGYDATRDLSGPLYAFGLARIDYDEFGPVRREGVAGAGLGWRVVQQETVAWNVQLGAGARLAEDATGDRGTDPALIAGSRLHIALGERAWISNDTEVVALEGHTLVTNEIGVNLRSDRSVITRVGVRTDYDSDPPPGYDTTDNRFSVSLIYAF